MCRIAQRHGKSFEPAFLIVRCKKNNEREEILDVISCEVLIAVRKSGLTTFHRYSFSFLLWTVERLLITFALGLQDRLTDHRINYSVNNLDGVMEGDGDSGLEDIISELRRNAEMGLIEDMLETVEKGDSSP